MANYTPTLQANKSYIWNQFLCGGIYQSDCNTKKHYNLFAFFSAVYIRYSILLLCGSTIIYSKFSQRGRW